MELKIVSNFLHLLMDVLKIPETATAVDMTQLYIVKLTSIRCRLYPFFIDIHLNSILLFIDTSISAVFNRAAISLTEHWIQ